jgi:hypothetical protein
MSKNNTPLEVQLTVTAAVCGAGGPRRTCQSSMARLRLTGKQSHSLHAQRATKLEALTIYQLAVPQDEDGKFISLAKEN